MGRIVRVGDQVRFKDTQFLGEVSGVGHTFMLMDSAKEHGFPKPTAMSGACFIVRLKEPFILTGNDIVVRGRAPSAFPNSIFVFEVAVSEDQLEVVQ